MNIQPLTTTQAADLLGVSERTIQAWYKSGEFPHAYKLNPTKRNSPLRIPRADVERITQQRTASLVTG